MQIPACANDEHEARTLLSSSRPCRHDRNAMTPTRQLHPVTLQGHGITLEALSLAHVDGLVVASAEGEIWRLNYTSVPGPGRNDVSAYVQIALDAQARGEQLPFAVISPDGDVVGSTRYLRIDHETPRLEIGYTWYAPRVQRTALNTACKRLLLGHAFENLDMVAVEFRTSHENLRSQAAITRLGAHHDGVMRHHMRHKDGSLRDTVVYSILAREWPQVRERLDARLATSR